MPTPADVFAELMKECESDRYSLRERLMLAAHLAGDSQDTRRPVAERELLIQKARHILKLVDTELKGQLHASISRG